MVDFAGGLVVHGAAGAAGLGIMLQIWREERRDGHLTSPQMPFQPSLGWLTGAILLLWVGWFGFNPGSVLAFNQEAIVVVETTFIAAAVAMTSTMTLQRLLSGHNPGPLYAVNGILIGLIVITPLAGFVSPGGAFVLGVLAGPIFIVGERLFARSSWFADPVGLLPGHLLGGLFGIVMIPVFAQHSFAAASGFPSLPDGLLFGGGSAAIHQLGIESLGIVVVMITVFAISFATVWMIELVMSRITTDYHLEHLPKAKVAEPTHG